MIDFEKFIKAAYADGLSTEDFMREITKAANAVAAEEKKSERDKAITSLKKQLERVKDYNYSLSDAVVVLMLAAANSPDNKDWTVDTINRFSKAALSQVTNLIGTFAQKETVHKIKSKEKERPKEARQPLFPPEEEVKKVVEGLMKFFED